MSTLIPPTPAANKSAEQHQEPSEQDSFNHLLYKVLRLTSEQVQDLNGWMEHRGIPNVHEVIAQNFRKPHALEDNLKFITQGKTCYIQSNVMISLSLMITYDTFLSMFRLCSCGTKPQRSENHHFVMTSSWEPQCHHDIIMRTPRITGKPKFSWSGGL